MYKNSEKYFRSHKIKMSMKLPSLRVYEMKWTFMSNINTRKKKVENYKQGRHGEKLWKSAESCRMWLWLAYELSKYIFFYYSPISHVTQISIELFIPLLSRSSWFTLIECLISTPTRDFTSDTRLHRLSFLSWQTRVNFQSINFSLLRVRKPIKVGQNGGRERWEKQLKKLKFAAPTQ